MGGPLRLTFLKYLVYHTHSEGQAYKVYDKEGNIREVKIWRVRATPDKPHGYKYSLAYIVKGRRVIGYDNAEARGDHRHYEDSIEPYRFEGVEKLIKDFYSDIQRYKEEGL